MKSITALLIVYCLFADSHADNVVQVTENGAKGDACSITVSTDLNSSWVTAGTGYSFTKADLGKVMMIYGAGPATSATNNQDYLGRIVKILGDSKVELLPIPGRTATNLPAMLGTDNSYAFQRCVDRAFGSNTVISVPQGNYLLIPPDLIKSEYRMNASSETRAAVMIQKGGITFRGENPKKTILTACGVWQLKGDFVSRGQLFQCRGPVDHSELPLVFENLTFDGGVLKGRKKYRGFPARTSDGSGWDITHDAIMDGGAQPLHALKVFRNCVFQHWRGEILKGVSGAMTGFIEVTDCDFHDGNASAFNFDVSHHVNHCTFSHLDMAMEFYEGRMDRPSCFENSSVSDVRADLVIVGALSNNAAPLYTIRNNDLQVINGFGILLNPAKNILIESNHFEGQGFCIGNGAGYQGTDCCRDIVIRGNRATNGGNFFLVQCGYENRMQNVLITGNTISGRGNLGCGWGYSTNVTFSNNIATNGGTSIDGCRLTGQWFRDDLSDLYRPHQVSNYSGITNLISYAYGAHQAVLTTKTNSIFFIDDTQPAKIPSGVSMVITNQGNHPVPLFLSATHPKKAPDMILNPSNTITCIWTNGVWKVEK